MFYTAVELQKTEQAAVLATCYEDKEKAQAKFYTVLAAAAVSALPYHAAWLLRSDGVVEEQRVFDRGEEENTGREKDV